MNTHLFGPILANVRTGRFADALRQLQDSEGIVSAKDRPLHRVLTVEMSHHAGAKEDARRLAERSLQEKLLPGSLQARCHSVLGSTFHEDGDLNNAVRHHQRAVRLAKETSDLELICWTQLKLMSALGDVSTPETSITIVQELRRNATRCGNPGVTTALHIALARMEAKRGSLDSARHHVALATSLLQHNPNPWLEGMLQLDECAIEQICGRFHRVVDVAKAALENSRQSGHQRTTIGALANLGQAYLYLGDFPGAERVITLAISRAPSTRIVHLSLLDSYAQLKLAQGQLDACTELLDEIDRLNPSHDTFRPSWLDLWIYQTRIRLLQRRGRWDEASHLATTAIRIAAERSDRLLGALFAVLKADSEVMLGRVAEAGVLLASASDACDSSQLETVAEIERVTAKALARQGRLTDAVPALDRAMRIADVVGNACLRAYIEADRPLITATGSVRERPGSTGARTARDATVLLQCGGRPELLGQEAMALLASLGYPGECRVERDDRNTDGGTLRIELGGSEGQVAWVLCVTPPGEFRAAEDLATVRKLITHALELERASRQARQRASFWEKAPLPRSAVAGVFVAKSTLDILDSAMKVAPTDIPILLTGETGTGKELLARAIHDGSPRAERTFLPFDCNSVPRDLLDSHLFGHRRGAFSGALENFPGVIRAAEGGTLFLDEIGELSLDLQPKLLRFLETRQVHPLGESNPVTVDVRIVAATNANLDRLVADGGFREDLFYRLNVIRFPLPPLRERREEIPPLAHHFLRHHAEDQGQAVPRLSDETLEYLLLYRWPGNVRELGNEMRRLVAFADPGAVIEPDALSPHILASRRTVPAAPRPSDRTVQVTLGQPLQRATDQLERAMIVDALAKTGGRVEAAARLLGLSRKGLYLKRQRLSVAS